MKIAVVIEHIETWRGGAETSSLELATLLAERGHEMHVITASRRPSTPTLTIHQAVGSAAIKPLRLRAFVRAAAQVVAGNNFDIVHAIVPLPCADVYQPRGGSIIETQDRNILLRRSTPARWFKRAMLALNLKHRSLAALERECCRPGGPIIAAVSQYVADQFARIHDLHPPRVRVIFNGVNIDIPSEAERLADRAAMRSTLRISDDGIVVLCVAHNFALKGMPRAVEAVGRLSDELRRRTTLVIVGRDNPVPLHRLADKYGIAENLRIIGPTQKISAYFHGADVCLHPTYYDPCSRVVLEAMALGVPPITTRFNGASEVIEDGVSGFVVDSPDAISQIAERLERLADSGLRQSMARASSAALEKISMAQHVDKLDKLFHELNESAPQPGKNRRSALSNF